MQMEDSQLSGVSIGSTATSVSLVPPAAQSRSISSPLFHDELVAEQESLNVLKQQLGVVQQIRLDHERKEAALQQLQDEVHELREFKAHAEDLANQLKIAHQTCNQRERDLHAVNKQNAELENNLRSQIIVLEEAQRDQLASSARIKQELEAVMAAQQIDAETKLNDFHKRTAEYMTKLLSFQQSLEQERGQRGVAEANVTRLQDALERLQDQMDGLTAKLAKTEDKNNKLRSDNRHLQSEIQSSQSSYKLKAVDLEANCNTWKTQVDHLNRQLEHLCQKNAKLESAKLKLEELLGEKQKEKDSLCTTVERLQLSEAELQAKKQESEKMGSSIAQLRVDLEKQAGLYQAAVANGMTIKDEVVKLTNLLPLDDKVSLSSSDSRFEHASRPISSSVSETLRSSNGSVSYSMQAQPETHSYNLCAEFMDQGALDWVAIQLGKLRIKVLDVTETSRRIRAESHELRLELAETNQRNTVVSKLLEQRDCELGEIRESLLKELAASQVLTEAHHEVEAELQRSQLEVQQLSGTLEMRMQWLNQVRRQMDRDSQPVADLTSWPELQVLFSEKVNKVVEESDILQRQLHDTQNRLDETQSNLTQAQEQSATVIRQAADEHSEVKEELRNALNYEQQRHEITQRSRNSLRSRLRDQESILRARTGELIAARRQAGGSLKAVQLLLRCVRPLRIRVMELIQQKRFISSRLTTLEEVKVAVDNLTDTVCNDLHDLDVAPSGLLPWWRAAKRFARFSVVTSSAATTGIVTFRGAVLAVLACNRFVRFGQSQSLGVPVCSRKVSSTKTTDIPMPHRRNCSGYTIWLSPDELITSKLVALVLKLGEGSNADISEDTLDHHVAHDPFEREWRASDAHELYSDEEADGENRTQRTVEEGKEISEQEEKEGDERKDDRCIDRSHHKQSTPKVLNPRRSIRTARNSQSFESVRSHSHGSSIVDDGNDLMRILQQAELLQQKRENDPVDVLNRGAWNDPRSLLGQILLGAAKRHNHWEHIEFDTSEAKDHSEFSKAASGLPVRKRVPLQIEVHLIHKVVLALAKRLVDAEAAHQQWQSWATDSLVQQDVHNRKASAAAAANQKLKELVAFLEARVKELSAEQVLMVPPERHDEVKTQKELVDLELDETRNRCERQLRELGECQAKLKELHGLVDKERLYSARIAQTQEQQREELSFSRAYLQRKESEAAQLHSLAQRHAVLQKQLLTVQGDLRAKTDEEKIVREELKHTNQRAELAEERYMKLETSVRIATQNRPNARSNDSGLENKDKGGGNSENDEASLSYDLTYSSPLRVDQTGGLSDRRQELLSAHSQAQSELENALNQTTSLDQPNAVIQAKTHILARGGSPCFGSNLSTTKEIERNEQKLASADSRVESTVDAYFANLDRKLFKNYGTPHSTRLPRFHAHGPLT